MLKITGTHHQTYRNALQFIVGKLEARTLVVCIIIFHRDTCLTQFLDHRCQALCDMLQVITLRDRYDDHLDWSELRRQHQTVVIRVCHDQCSDETCRYAPRSSPYILRLIVLVQILYLKGLGEVLTEEVTGTALKCLTILHHSLDGICVEGTCKTLCLTLHTLDHGYCHPLFSELGIDLQHQLGLLLCLFTGGMSRMTFLPEELRSTQERTSTHLPAHHVTPLVTHQGQVAP